MYTCWQSCRDPHFVGDLCMIYRYVGFIFLSLLGPRVVLARDRCHKQAFYTVLLPACSFILSAEARLAWKYFFNFVWSGRSLVKHPTAPLLWKADHYCEKLIITVKSWPLLWKADHYCEKLTITVKSWPLLWKADHYCEKLTITVKSWSLLWKADHYCEKLTITVKSWPLLWKADHYCEKLTITVKSWSLLWKADQFHVFPACLSYRFVYRLIRPVLWLAREAWTRPPNFGMWKLETRWQLCKYASVLDSVWGRSLWSLLYRFSRRFFNWKIIIFNFSTLMKTRSPWRAKTTSEPLYSRTEKVLPECIYTDGISLCPFTTGLCRSMLDTQLLEISVSNFLIRRNFRRRKLRTFPCKTFRMEVYFRMT